MSKLYVAYGSNLNLKQMAYRCPTATLVGTGAVSYTHLVVAVLFAISAVTVFAAGDVSSEIESTWTAAQPQIKNVRCV